MSSQTHHHILNAHHVRSSTQSSTEMVSYAARLWIMHIPPYKKHWKTLCPHHLSPGLGESNRLDSQPRWESLYVCYSTCLLDRSTRVLQQESNCHCCLRTNSHWSSLSLVFWSGNSHGELLWSESPGAGLFEQYRAMWRRRDLLLGKMPPQYGHWCMWVLPETLSSIVSVSDEVWIHHVVIPRLVLNQCLMV